MDHTILEQKETLLENIKRTNDLVKRLHSNYGDYYKIKRKPLRFHFGYHLLALFVYFLIFGTLTAIFLTAFYQQNLLLSDDMIKWLKNASFGEISLYVAAILLIIYIFLYVSINKVTVTLKSKWHKRRIKEISQEQIELLSHLENESVIPEDYWNIYALNKFEKYLINKRADSLKEIINLFEQEKRHDQQIREMKIMQSIQQATYKKTKQVARRVY